MTILKEMLKSTFVSSWHMRLARLVLALCCPKHYWRRWGGAAPGALNTWLTPSIPPLSPEDFVQLVWGCGRVRFTGRWLVLGMGGGGGIGELGGGGPADHCNTLCHQGGGATCPYIISATYWERDRYGT